MSEATTLDRGQKTLGDVVIEAKDLSRDYVIGGSGLFGEPSTVKALRGASFTLRANETLAVVGESGCGKSTLARLVAMIEEPSGGSLTIDGIDLSKADGGQKRRLRQAVQFVFQDPYGSLNPRQKVGAMLEEPLKINTKDDRATRRKKAIEMLERVGLRAEHYERYPHMFSGGQRQRIAIARALVLRPRILVLDEPVSALDVSIQAQVLNILSDLQEEFGLAYLFISHDLSVVKHVAENVMVMYLGRPVEKGPRDEIFERPRHPYTRALLSATPVADPTHRRERVALTGELPSPVNPPSGCSFHPRCPIAFEPCPVDRPALLPHGRAMVACHAVTD